ncbi:LysR substrate-binding domain-containing protein [Acidovorax sp. CCYZU-2555]|uniref:LysR substrate-binding domain-containing protein n=1 Tax=Acidovorax sp. CCYZU-2555 TaxID=2835042 RepID=UPI001BCE1417|nr:LysR substrate-binding domain-containing protein [Acidovorax sp. CCYZU-2555]MBS7776535.1 LysR family transcriptional regulator [Acidovorax sp. CCYZU-2555]
MRHRLPPLNTLRVFEAIYRRGSIRQAADELCLTPQAVSQQLKLLESSLGQELFERNIRSLTPTPAAHLLYEPVKQGFDSLAKGVLAVTDKDARRTLVLHVSPYFATQYLIRNLGHFKAEFPDIDVRMLVGVEMPDLQQQGIDAAIHWGYGGIPLLSETPLVEDLKVLVAAPSLLARLPVNMPEDLLKHSLVLPLAENTLWQDTLELLGLRQTNQQPALQLHTHDAMLEAMLAGLGIGHISYLDALAHIQAGSLVAPFGVDLLKQLPLEKSPRFFLYYRPDRKNYPVLKRFSEWLQSDVCRPEVIGFESRCRVEPERVSDLDARAA